MEYAILYLCDQKKDCNISDLCGRIDEDGNGCMYTVDPKHAKNGPVANAVELLMDPEERFEYVKMGNIEFWREKQ